MSGSALHELRVVSGVGAGTGDDMANNTVAEIDLRHLACDANGGHRWLHEPQVDYITHIDFRFCCPRCGYAPVSGDYVRTYQGDNHVAWERVP